MGIGLYMHRALHHLAVVVGGMELEADNQIQLLYMDRGNICISARAVVLSLNGDSKRII